MAPEVCSQSGHDEQADIWSLGITLIEMAQGQPPWCDLQPMSVIMKILEADAPKLEGPDWSQEFRDIVGQMLNKKSQERPTCKQLLDNEANNFLKNASNSTYIINNLLAELPPL